MSTKYEYHFITGEIEGLDKAQEIINDVLKDASALEEITSRIDAARKELRAKLPGAGLTKKQSRVMSYLEEINELVTKRDAMKEAGEDTSAIAAQIQQLRDEMDRA